jgi:hypothetical protein
MAMHGPKLYGNYAYGRGRSFLPTGAIVKLIDYSGDYNILRVGRREPMGNMVAQFTSAGNPIPAGGASNFAEFRFTEPAQEGRLFQFRPIVFGVNRATHATLPGRVVFPGIPDNVLIPAIPAPVVDYMRASIPMGVAIQVQHPSGDFRWGTDQKRDVVVTTPGGVVLTSAGVGGVDGGFLEAPLAPFLDDPSDLWDMWTIFGHTIAIRMVNRTNFFWPPGINLGQGAPAAPIDIRDYFVALIGAKYVLLEVPEAIVKKVEEREIDYQPIVIGGIPSVTTKA